MALFLIDMLAYFISLIAAFALMAFAGFQIGGSETANILTVILAAPLACWAVGLIHWKAYNQTKALIPQLAAKVRATFDSATSEIATVVEAVTEYSCAAATLMIDAAEPRKVAYARVRRTD